MSCTLASGFGQKEPKGSLLPTQKVFQAGKCQFFHVSAISSNPASQNPENSNSRRWRWGRMVCLKPNCCEARKTVGLGGQEMQGDAEVTFCYWVLIHWTPCPLSGGGNNEQEHLAFQSMKRPKPTILLCSLSCCRNQLQTALRRKEKKWNLTKMNFSFHCCGKGGEGDSDSSRFACNCYCRHDYVTGTVI